MTDSMTPSSKGIFPGQMTSEPNCIVSESDKGFSYWVNREYISDDLRARMAGSNVLIVPFEGFRDLPYPVFPVQTVELFHLIKESNIQDISLDICIADKDYKELALHKDTIQIASFVVQYGVLPIITSIVANFIYKRLGSRFDRTNVKATMFIEKEKQTTFLEYDGPADAYEKTIMNIYENLNKDKKDTQDG